MGSGKYQSALICAVIFKSTGKACCKLKKEGRKNDKYISAVTVNKGIDITLQYRAGPIQKQILFANILFIAFTAADK